MMGRRFLCAVAALAMVGSGFAGVIQNPEMIAVNLGVECPSWTWKVPPHVEGAYEADGFHLTGNGHAIYMCWDRAGFAFTIAEELTCDFRLTGRLKDIPADGPGTVGITVKASLDAHTPVLDFRWDYYWQNHGGVGLSWLNRVTESSRIAFCDNCEKGDCLGTNCPGWEGCLGQGFENRVPGFDKRDDLWLRVERTGSLFHLYAKYGTDADWTEAVPKSAGTAKYPAMDLTKLQGGFKVPETVGGLVYAGFTVAGVEYGSRDMSAIIDNIELETFPCGTADQTKARKGKVHTRQVLGARVVAGEVQVATVAGIGIRSAQLIDLSGRLLAARDGASVPLSRKLPAGMYRISAVTTDGTTVNVPLMVR